MVQKLEIPACLRRRLVFGDAEQIAAIARLDAAVEEREEREKAMAEGRLYKWRVEFVVCENEEQTVTALDEDDAKELVGQMHDSRLEDIVKVTRLGPADPPRK